MRRKKVPLISLVLRSGGGGACGRLSREVPKSGRVWLWGVGGITRWQPVRRLTWDKCCESYREHVPGRTMTNVLQRLRPRASTPAKLLDGAPLSTQCPWRRGAVNLPSSKDFDKASAVSDCKYFTGINVQACATPSLNLAIHLTMQAENGAAPPLTLGKTSNLSFRFKSVWFLRSWQRQAILSISISKSSEIIFLHHGRTHAQAEVVCSPVCLGWSCVLCLPSYCVRSRFAKMPTTHSGNRTFPMEGGGLQVPPPLQKSVIPGIVPILMPI